MQTETSRLQIVMIEDDEDDFTITRDLLQESGASFDLHWFTSLKDGMDHLAESSGDVALLDLSLPDSHGWETFVALHERSRHLPIILLTGLDDETLGMRAIKEGAQDYLVKGQLDSRSLMRAIRYAVQRKKSEQILARVARELHARNRELADDLTMAREVQQALLPSDNPVFPPGAAPEDARLLFQHRYRPCSTVGGDFFSIFPAGDDRAGLLICDVMGHGIRAALVTAIVRGLLEELKPQADQPGRFLSEMNSGLLSVLRRPDQLIFASALYLSICFANGTIACANAGHPAPLRLNREKGLAEWLTVAAESHGPALGIMEHYAYSERSLKLESGDVLVAFTDGLFEAENDTGAAYGQERLLSSLQAAAGDPLPTILDRILDEADSFVGTDGFDDDICLVGLQLGHTGQPIQREAGHPAS